MLEHIPAWLGASLRDMRAGHAKLAIAQPGLSVGDRVIDLSSPAFAQGTRLPERFTADGAGVSPPLLWGEVPAETRALALIVEDPDAPFPNPLVHAIVWRLSPQDHALAEGAIAPDGKGGAVDGDVGRNSYLSEGWLPPDPPTGHGPHDYVFQLFALNEMVELGGNPGRSAMLGALEGRVIASGLLVGTYSRGEPAIIAPAGATSPAA